VADPVNQGGKHHDILKNIMPANHLHLANYHPKIDFCLYYEEQEWGAGTGSVPFPCGSAGQPDILAS
jgi:hypothetical protein